MSKYYLNKEVATSHARELSKVIVENNLDALELLVKDPESLATAIANFHFKLVNELTKSD